MSLRTTALRTGGLVCTVLLAFSLTGCPSDPDMPDAPMGSDAGDAGRDAPMGDGGGCTGTLCTTAGVTCEGNSLVTCAMNAAGCLVETTVNCALDDQVCDATLATPACVDACADVPVADRCDTDGARVCTGETLEVCNMNSDGCLVLERTECDAMPGGACAMGTAMLECLLPVDPCAGLTDACTTAGTSCDTDNLVTCAPNAFGCLVETTVDCTTAAAGACDDSGAAAVCTTTDVCPPACTAGTSCDGPELVTCAADAFGCLVETRTDCTDETFGFCDADATPAAMCSTAATDPCMGVTQCGSAPARMCTDDTLTVCAANAFGCFIATDTDCAADGNICNPDEPAMCVPPSVCGDGVIEGSETCDDDNVDAGDGCSDVCATETGYVCTGSPSVCAISIAAAGSSITLSGSLDDTDPTWARPFADCSVRTAAEIQYRDTFLIVNDTGSAQTIDLTATWLEDGYLFVYEAPFDLSLASCVIGDDDFDADGPGPIPGIEGSQIGTVTIEAGEILMVVATTFDEETASGAYSVVVATTQCGDGVRAVAEGCDDGDTDAGDGCSATCTVETGYGCTTATPNVCTLNCGNGVRQTGEACDDANVTPGDGCSATCTVESGFVCNTASPTVCAGPATNGTCATATAVTASATFPIVNYATGGPKPTGAGCGGGTGTLTVYYSVNVPANTVVNVASSGTADGVLMIQNACADAGCTAAIDAGAGGAAETTSFTNATATAFTRIVGLRAFGNTTTSTLGISFTYLPLVCGDGIRVGAETCDDGNTTAGDGCSATCTVEPNYTCTTATPNVCTPNCGNGTINAGEACDDGNATSGDGCSATCTVESNEIATGTGTPVAIPDNMPGAGVNTTATVTTACTVASVELTVAVTHTWTGDVGITLTAPGGTPIQIIPNAGTGSSSDLLGPYVFAASGGGNTAWPGSGSPVAAGRYIRTSMAGFAGATSAGTWTLNVEDNGNLDTGTLQSWSIAVRCAP